MSTTVISVRGRIPDELRKDPDFVYVGRRCAGWNPSIWGNPYRVIVRNRRSISPGDRVRIGADDRDCPDAETAVARYRDWVLRGGGGFVYPYTVLLDLLPTLRGKTLGCWCGAWHPGDPDLACHAVVLAKLADSGAALGG